MKQIIVIVVLTLMGTVLLEQVRPVHRESSPIIGLIEVKVPNNQFKPLLDVANTLQPNFITATVEAKPAPSGGGDIETIVRQAARKYGIDEEHFLSIARCESGLNPNAVNLNYAENGNPSGLFQHLSGYWPARAAKYGYTGASVFDATANANVTAGMFRDGASNLWECH